MSNVTLTSDCFRATFQGEEVFGIVTNVLLRRCVMISNNEGSRAGFRVSKGPLPPDATRIDKDTAGLSFEVRFALETAQRVCEAFEEHGLVC